MSEETMMDRDLQTLALPLDAEAAVVDATDDPSPVPVVRPDAGAPGGLRGLARDHSGVLALLVLLAVLAVVAVLFVPRWTAKPPEAARYTTATAATGSVSQALTLTGTVAKSGQESLHFPAAGTVSSVLVGLGDRVTAGQEIAAMGTTSLQYAVDSAQSAYDQAVLSLEQLEAAADAAASASASAAATPTDAPSRAGAQGQLGGMQQAVQQAQGNADQAQGAVSGALAVQNQMCANVVGADGAAQTTTAGSGGGGHVPGDRPAGAPAGTAPTDTTPSEPAPADTTVPVDTSSASAAEIEACAQAMAAVRTAQGQLTAAQAALSQANTALLQALMDYQASLPTTNTGGGGSGGVTPRNVTQAQLQDAKNAVTTTTAALAQAQANLAAATLVSPIDGVVASLPFRVGDAVSASTSVVIIGSGAITVSVSVPAASISLVAAGQPVAIRQASVGEVKGTVGTVGLLPGTNGFPVVVSSSDAGADAFLVGVPATVAITVSTSANAVVVPLSAVVRDAAGSMRGTVVVLADDGSTTTESVTLGAVGDTRVAITEGLQAGQKVVLADSQTVLPSTGTLNLGALRGGGVRTTRAGG